MEPYPPINHQSNMRLHPTKSLHQAIHSLYFDGQLVGTAFAVHPSILITAGHHYLATTEDCGLMSVQSHFNTWNKIRDPVKTERHKVLYAQKDQYRDLLVMWIAGVVDWAPVRGLQPPMGQRVVTCWVNLKAPHDLIITTGVVTASTPKVCHTKGTITVRGSSGGAVLDHTGEELVGMHIATNDNEANREDGSAVGRLSEFLTSREIIATVQRMGIDLCKPWSAGDEPEHRPKKEATPQKGAPGNESKKTMSKAKVRLPAGKTEVAKLSTKKGAKIKQEALEEANAKKKSSASKKKKSPAAGTTTTKKKK